MFLRGRHCRSRPPQLLHNSGPLDFYRTHSGLGVLILNPHTLLAETDFQLRFTRLLQDPFRLGSLPQIPHSLLDCRDTDFQLRSTQSLQDPFRLGILSPQSSHVASLQRQIFNSGPLDFYMIHSGLAVFLRPHALLVEREIFGASELWAPT